MMASFDEPGRVKREGILTRLLRFWVSVLLPKMNKSARVWRL